MKTIKKTTLYYKNPNTGEFVSLDVVGEKTAEEIKREIEEKGQETLNGIPNDYTILTKEVKRVDSGLTDVTDNVKIVRNHVTEVVQGKYCTKSNGKVVILDNEDYGYAKAELKPNTYYSFNTITETGVNFGFFADLDDNVIGVFENYRDTSRAGYVFLTPENTAYFIGSSNKQERYENMVILETEEDITAYTIEEYPIGENKETHIKNMRYGKNIVIVEPHGYGNCKTIQQAIDNITDDTAENRYTIIVMPGVYESINMIEDAKASAASRIRYLDIIGLNRDTCIVKNDSGDYYNPPANVKFVGTMKNLSLIATHEENEAWNSNGNSGAYGLHYDHGTVGGTMKFENCYIASYQTAAVGLGTWDGTGVEFKNCIFERFGDDTEGASYGAFFCHTQAITDGTIQGVAQKLTVENCRFLAHAGRNAGLISNSFSIDESRYEYTFINCATWCDTTNSTKFGKENAVVSKYSFGNQSNELNA